MMSLFNKNKNKNKKTKTKIPLSKTLMTLDTNDEIVTEIVNQINSDVSIENIPNLLDGKYQCLEVQL